MRVEPAIFIDDMGVSFDIRYKQLWRFRKRRHNAINCSIPVGGEFPGDVALGEFRLMSFQKSSQSGVSSQLNQPAVFRERIDNAKATPLDGTAQNVLRHSEGQLAVRFDVKLAVWTDKHLVGAGGYADTDFAPGVFEKRKVTFQTTNQGS